MTLFMLTTLKSSMKLRNILCETCYGPAILLSSTTLEVVWGLVEEAG